MDTLAQKGITNINLDILKEKGYVRGKNTLVKVLSGGSITQAVTISIHAISTSARSAIEKAGGTVTLLS